MTAMRILPALALSGLLFGATSVEAQPKNCNVPTFRTVMGQTAEAEMTVRAGNPCRITLGTSLAAISDARILTKSAVGSVSVQGTTVVYVAKAGFTGADRFTWAWAGRDRWGNERTWPVEVSVKVIP